MKIVYKRRALRHLEAIHTHIARHDPDAAKRVILRIQHSIDRLLAIPLSARVGEVPGTRILTVPGLPYVVIHRVLEDKVEIIAVFHTAQQTRS